MLFFDYNLCEKETKATLRIFNLPKVLMQAIKHSVWRMLSVLRGGRFTAQPPACDTPAELYEQHVENRRPTEGEVAYYRAVQQHMTSLPKITVVIDAGSIANAMYERALASVASQIYGCYNCVIVTDTACSDFTPASGDVLTASGLLEKLNLSLVSSRGLVNALSTEIRGDYFCFLGAGDVLHHDALLRIALELSECPSASLVYSDEDQVDDHGRRSAPLLKPDWSPDLLLSQNYIGRLCVYRASVLDADGSNVGASIREIEYGLTLRSVESGDPVVHIPAVLYSRGNVIATRLIDVALHDDHEKASLEAALLRRGIDASVEEGGPSGCWRVRYRLFETPRVSIIIPSGGSVSNLRTCLESIFALTTYTNYECCVVDNSLFDEVDSFCKQLVSQGRSVRRIEFRDKPFNFSAINNFAVSKTDAEYVVLLNDDTRLMTPDWIQSMLEHAQRDSVGIVGVKLLYPDDRIQHAGVVLGIFGCAGHAFKFVPDAEPSYGNYRDVVRNYSAVTMACAMIRRSVYLEFGGLDAARFPVAFNDIDFCLKLREKQSMVVYTPYVVFYHMESTSRMQIQGPNALEWIYERWSHRLLRDPYYNPGLTKSRQDFSLLDLSRS